MVLTVSSLGEILRNLKPHELQVGTIEDGIKVMQVLLDEMERVIEVAKKGVTSGAAARLPDISDGAYVGYLDDIYFDCNHVVMSPRDELRISIEGITPKDTEIYTMALQLLGPPAEVRPHPWPLKTLHVFVWPWKMVEEKLSSKQ